MPVYQGLAFQHLMQKPVQTYCRFIRSSFAELITYHSYVNFGTRSAWS